MQQLELSKSRIFSLKSTESQLGMIQRYIKVGQANEIAIDNYLPYNREIMASHLKILLT